MRNPKTLLAHKVQVSGDVGATLHLEPNDTPRAGEATLTWFALTRRGGQVIPLEDCDCQLAVYAMPQTQDTPLLEPDLRPVSAEGYQNIPGADITFPQVGRYELVLQGEPRQAEAFPPFELRYEVTVATGRTSSTANATATAQESQAPEAPQNPQAADAAPESGMTWPGGTVFLGVVLLGAIACLIYYWQRRSAK